VLRDGSTVHVRPVLKSDEGGLLDFLKRLSLETLAFRFFSGGANLKQAAKAAVDVDYRDDYALVTTLGEKERIVAYAELHSVDGDRAEVAFAIADELQGRGLGTILFAHLAEAAAERGIQVFEAEVLRENHRMLEVFRESGFPAEIRAEPGCMRVESPTSLSDEAIERFELRDQIAAREALRHFLEPRSIAVIGASRERGTVGGEVFHNLLQAEFKGPVYPVNPNADVVQSVPAYRSVEDLPGQAELAVIAVPAEHVVSAAEQCARVGAKAMVVISAGFAEAGIEGKTRQRELLRTCRRNGMRLIGPNCLGIVNTSPDVSLNATFGPRFPPAGKVGFLSQSGALGLAVIDFASALDLGLSSFASVGNKADISGNDLISYWAGDERTELILLYLESFGNPRKFARLARRVGATKPIVAVKSGRSSAGTRATSSHTGAMVAASDVTVDALFRQAGVIRTDTLHELFDVASLLSNQPLPRGPNVAILTNAGGPGILCADACESEGLSVPELPASARTDLAKHLAEASSVGNPVDMLATASAEDYRRSIGILGSCETVDALVVIFIPPLVTSAEDVAAAMRSAVSELDRRLPVAAVFMSHRGVPNALRHGETGIPSYAFPEDAAHALARATRYCEWRERPAGHIAEFADLRAADAAQVIAAALARRREWLEPPQAAALLSCYGIPIVEWREADSPDGAAIAAAELGGEVALKAVAPGLEHKTESGGVRLGLRGSQAVAAAAEEMSKSVASAGYEAEAFVVQRMASGGEEMLVGVVGDPLFGPVVACGAGGVTTELLRDVAVRITPLTDVDASEMLRSLKTFPLLDGYRGRPKADVPALEEILLRISVMVEAHPEIVEMDLNPVLVSESGAEVLDSRIRVEPAPPRRPWPAVGTSAR
jgi:acetyl coenzyme A synthetase (ADP forming)-like protein